MLETYCRGFLEGKEREFLVEGVRQRERLQEEEAREGGGRAPTLELCQPFTLHG